MPRVTKTAQEHDADSAIAKAVEETLASVAVTTSPVVICGVNRKANLGGGTYENIDIYFGLTLPLVGVSTEDMETLVEAINTAADAGFAITSKVTYDKYNSIKEAQKKPR